MLKPTPWFKRVFPKKIDASNFLGIIERLEGTPLRLEKKVLQFSDEFLTQFESDNWSIQEHTGHLLNLEWLWYARFNDILNNAPVLTEADLTNQATYDAVYNEQAIENIIETFAEVRAQLVFLLRNIREEDLNKSATHPRLNTPMTIIDLAFFVAEHDDHHLAMIQFLSTQ